VIWGTRTAFRVGLIITGVTSCMGLLVGSLAAYYGGASMTSLMQLWKSSRPSFLLAALTLASGDCAVAWARA
jgi:ABC-type dipeptide/oligopeptide/nickel transport system permease subunit